MFDVKSAEGFARADRNLKSRFRKFDRETNRDNIE